MLRVQLSIIKVVFKNPCVVKARFFSPGQKCTKTLDGSVALQSRLYSLVARRLGGSLVGTTEPPSHPNEYT